MALFGRKRGALDYPPHDSGSDSEAISIPEPIFRPKPEELDISTLVEKARAGEAINVVPELNDFFDGWVHYAQDRNIFVGSESINALAHARREAIDLAAKKDFEGLQAKLEELAGPVAAKVEAAADANIRHIQESKEATPKENREALASAVGETQELLLDQPYVPETSEPLPGRTMSERFANIPEQAPTERAALDAAEAAYLERFKEYHRTKGLFGKEPEELLDLKETYNEARVAYANALEASVAKRLEGKRVYTEEMRLDYENALKVDRKRARERLNDKSEETSEDRERQKFIKEYGDEFQRRSKVMRRYNSMIRYKAVVEPTAQKLYDARLEAIGQREKGIFGKGVEWFAKKNAALDNKYGKNRARFIRAAASTLIVGGGAAAIGAFGAAGALSILGLGAMRFGRVLASTFSGAAAGEINVRLYEPRGKRKQSEAKKELATQGKHGESHLNVLELEAYDRNRMKLTKEADERTLERKKVLIRALTALGVGAGMSGILAELPSASGMSEHVPVAAGSEPHSVLHSSTNVEHKEVFHHTNTPIHEATASTAHIDSVSVHGNVNDADKLFGRFVDNARAQFPNPADAPPALRALLEQYHHVDGMHQQDVLTRFLHLQNGGSVVVHPGDTLSYEDGKVVFQGHTLIDEHGTVHNLREGGLVDIEHPHPHVAPTSQHVEQSVTHETVQPATQSVTVPQTSPQAPVEAAPPVTPEPVTTSAPEHVAQPAPEPEHIVEQPAPVRTSAPEHSSTVSHVPIQEPSAVNHSGLSTPSEHIEHPSPSNDNTPSLESTTPGINHEAFINPHGVNIEPRGVHLYGVAEGRGKETLIAYGTPDPTFGKDFMGSISDLLKRNPTATVYFQSPTPTYINGVPQPWISSATLSPDGSVIVSVTPSDSNLVGVKINPETFTRVIN